MTGFTQVLKTETMSAEQSKNIIQRMAASAAGRKGGNDQLKNRNLHSVKFPDDLEADYQQWKIWWKKNDNAALRHLVQTHPDLKRRPEQ